MKQETKVIVKKVLSIILNSFFYVFIAFMLIFAIAHINKGKTTIPNVFGTGFLSVASDSMTGSREDSFVKDDLIFVKVVNDKNRDKLVNSLEIGDVITFQQTVIVDNKPEAILNSHRIVDYRTNSDGKKYEFVTQGDKRNATNPYIKDGANDPAHYEIVSQFDICGIYKSKWSGAGKALNFIQSQAGFAVVIVIPTAILFAYELFVLIRLLMKANKEKLEAKHEEEKEQERLALEKRLAEERELMRQQLLEELKKSKTEE